MMLRALIFDLDNCLVDPKEAGEEFFAPVVTAIRRVNNGRLNEVQLREAFDDMWAHPFDWAAERHRFSEEMHAAGWKEYAQLEIRTPMTGYGDLSMLDELPQDKFLVTAGFRRLQESKIDALGLRARFTALYVDAIDEAERVGKFSLFSRILREHQLTAGEALVIGDNPDSEIEAGNRLGIPTVQILRPRVIKSSRAAYHIESLAGLKELLKNF